MEMDCDQLIDAYLDGELNSEAAESLGHWVQANPANAEHFLRCVALHWDVYTQLQANQAIRTMRETAPSPRRKPLFAPVLSALKEMAGQPVMLAVLVVSLVSVAILARHFSQQPLPVARAGKEVEAKPRTVVARLKRTVGATWQQQLAYADGSALSAGQRLALQQGLAEISFDTGATVILEGPAELTLGPAERADVPPSTLPIPPPTANACSLTLGKLVARVPREAHGFTVHTPNMKIVDLGTEFAVDVSATTVTPTAAANASAPPASGGAPQSTAGDTFTAVHVLLGEVAIRPMSAGPGKASEEKPSTIMKAGQAAVSKPGEIAPRMVPAEPTKFVRELPPADSGASPHPLSPGDIVAVNRNKLTLVKIDPQTGEQKVLARGNRDLHGWEWMCAAVDPQGKILVGTDRGQGRGGQVLRIDSRDGSIDVLASTGLMSEGRISGLTVAADGRIFAAQDSAEDKVLQIDPQSGAAATVAPFGGNIWGIAADVGGHDLLAVSDLGDALTQIRGQTVSSWVRNPMFEGAPRGVAVRPDGRVFVSATSHTHGRIVEVDRTTHRLTEVVSVPRQEWTFGMLAVDPDGQLIVSKYDAQSSIYRIDVDARTIVAVATGGQLEQVLGVAVVPGRPAAKRP